MRVRRVLGRIARDPLAHFLALGAVLFVVAGLVRRAPEQTGRIVVTTGEVEHLATGFALTWQRSPTPRELEGLIEDHVREEVLYREALALGLERDDVIVRRRLRQKMEFLVEDQVSAAPSDAELRIYLAEHADAFREEPRVAFRQLFLDVRRRGPGAKADAQRLLDRLSVEGDEADTTGLGDALLVPEPEAPASLNEIARLFGDMFAARLRDLEPGRWVGPVASGLGLHLVFIRSRTSGRMPKLAEVRDAVLREWLAARHQEAKDGAYRRLRARYQVISELQSSGGVAAR